MANESEWSKPVLLFWAFLGIIYVGTINIIMALALLGILAWLVKRYWRN